MVNDINQENDGFAKGRAVASCQYVASIVTDLSYRLGCLAEMVNDENDAIELEIITARLIGEALAIQNDVRAMIPQTLITR